jgi:hypothetical protein
MTESQNHSASGNRSSIKLSFSLTRNDILWYNLHFNRGVIVLAVVFLILLFPGLLLAIHNPGGDIGTFYIWLEIGFAMGLIISISGIIAIVAQVFFIKSEAVEKAMQLRNYNINSDGVEISSAEGHLARSWDDFKKIIKTRRGYYLRTSDKAAIIFPNWVFNSADDYEAFKKLIKPSKK